MPIDPKGGSAIAGRLKNSLQALDSAVLAITFQELLRACSSLKMCDVLFLLLGLRGDSRRTLEVGNYNAYLRAKCFNREDFCGRLYSLCALDIELWLWMLSVRAIYFIDSFSGNLFLFLFASFFFF